MKILPIFTLGMLLLPAVEAVAQSDSIRYVPLPEQDSINRILVHKLHLQARGYKHRVALRWAPEGYPAWRVGLQHGYRVERRNQTLGTRDTLVEVLRPLPDAEAFGNRFGRNDSLALAASELIYGRQPAFDGLLNFNQIAEEQQSIYSYSMLIADRRPDLAEAMGLCYIDSTADARYTYAYSVIPLRSDSTFYFPGIQEIGVRLGTYNEEPYPYAPIDSIQEPATVELRWPNIYFSAYDIERRHAGSGNWQRLNNLPYMTVAELKDSTDMPLNIYYDYNVPIGKWEYRIAAYDLFGERTQPGPSVTVEMVDLVPPSIPLITQFIVDPESQLMEIRFVKDSIEDDLAGYQPVIYNKEKYGDQWINMTDRVFLPSDTSLILPVGDFEAGMVSISAIDRAGNRSYSIPRQFRMPDHRPPSVPKNLRAAVSPMGKVVILWSPSPEKDVQGYTVYSANDTTHQFMQLPRPLTNDTIAFDSLSLSVIQPYIYYKVEAWDWSGNGSMPSHWIQVARPNYIPPQPCMVDSVWQNDEGLFSRWLPSPEPDIREYRVLRRLRGQAWQIAYVLPADSLRADGKLWVHDVPAAMPNDYYEYAIESVNRTGARSGASKYVSYRWTGPVHVPVELTLGASYREDEDCVVLAWDVKGLEEDLRPGGFYAIYYRKDGDADYTFFRACQLSEYSTVYRRIPHGKSVRFYMCYRNDRQQYGPYSEIVTVEIPAVQPQE